VPELQAIAARNFAPGEQRSLQALPVPRQADAFLACWTRKEAFVKALGGGLSVPLDGFEVSLDPDAPARLLHSADPAHPVADFTLWAGRTPAHGWAACAVRRARATVRTFSLR
jgi:4'-phosphopantetheinyl transferase